MKKQSNSFLSKFSKKEMASLTTEVKETIAFGFAAPQEKIFTAAELWSIQRRIKATPQRRFL